MERILKLLDGAKSVTMVCKLQNFRDNFKEKFKQILIFFFLDEFPVQLQKTRLAFVDTKECNKSWVKELDHPDITNNSLCVFREKTDICAGDSGSPLMNSAEDGVQYVVGVASFTNFCDQTQPAVYVSVLPYIDWIISVVRNFC